MSGCMVFGCTLKRVFVGLFVFMITAFNPVLAEGEAAEKKEYVGYVELKPFVTNVSGTHFLKCEVSIQVGAEAAHHSINQHTAQIRNDLVFLFSAQDIKTLEKVEGQETLAKDALELVRKTLLEEDGEAMVNDLFFTSFVVQ